MNILNAIDKALAPKVKATKPPLPGLTPSSFGQPQRPKPAATVTLEQTLQRAVQGLDLAAPEELKQLAAIQSRWDAAWNDHANVYSLQNADAEFARRNRDQWAAIYTTNQDPRAVQIETQAGVRAEFEQRRELAKQACHTIGNEALRVCGPIRQRAIEQIGKLVERLEADEQAEAEAYAVEFHASPRLQTLKALLARLTHNERSGLPHPPRTILPFIAI